ncbi:MAG: ceramidase domain-containing protein [Rhodoglobus sp.]
MRFWSRAGIAVAATVVVGAASYLSALILPAGRPATCVDTGCFCEAVSGGIPTQIEASWSSLAFVLLGVWVMLSRGRTDSRERTLLPLAGLTMVAIGVSSFVYHARLTFLGQWLDVFSMYLLGLLIALGALWRAGRLGGRASVGLYVALAIGLGVAQFLYPDARRILFALVLLPGVILELTPYIAGRGAESRRWVLASLATFVLAYAIWILDQSALCDPQFWLQGHAVWHVLGAVAALLLTVHWRRTGHTIVKPDRD